MSGFVASKVKVTDKRELKIILIKSVVNLTCYQRRICLGGLKKTMNIREDSQRSGTSPAKAWRFLRQHKLLRRKMPFAKHEVPLRKLQTVARNLRVCKRLPLGRYKNYSIRTLSSYDVESENF